VAPKFRRETPGRASVIDTAAIGRPGIGLEPTHPSGFFQVRANGVQIPRLQAIFVGSRGLDFAAKRKKATRSRKSILRLEVTSEVTSEVTGPGI